MSSTLVKRLHGKVAIVTGAGRGIGRGIAIAYAREGARQHPGVTASLGPLSPFW